MLVIENLTKAYGKQCALSDFSFCFEQGTYALLGPNGAGKTTLMRSILGLLRYSNGTVLFDDKVIQPGSLIGYLPQKSGVFPALSVREHLEYYANLKNIPKTEWEQEICRVSELFHLEEILDKKGRKLSGGMVRRVGLAQAFLGNPRLVILDEPAEGLDPEERIRFRSAIRQSKGDTITIISTHIVDDIRDLADEILIMNQGKLISSGTPIRIQELASNMYYQIPEHMVLAEDSVVEMVTTSNGTFANVLTKRLGLEQYRLEPTIEAGYLCTIRGLLE